VGTYYRQTWAEVSLDAIAHNYMQFRQALPAEVRIMAVVKANAYGHGAIEVAKEALRCGAGYLGVASLDEAIPLREAGIQAPILVLGYTAPDAVDAAAEHDVTLTVYSEDVLRAVSAGFDRHRKPIKLHIKLDTGMGRIGIVGEQEAIAFIDLAMHTPGAQVEGLFTHYACADQIDKAYTLEQHRRFERVIAHYREQGFVFPYAYAGNSAIGIDIPELAGNMLRLGISLYGLYPSAEVNREQMYLRPAMTFKTKVSMVKVLPPGSGVSYGATYRTAGEETIATLPVGYGDGYTRLLTGKAEALIHGVRVPVVGRICMDQCMIHVSNVPDVRVGDEVVLFGRQGEHELSADELADRLGTINYEITCMVNARVPRVFVRD